MKNIQIRYGQLLFLYAYLRLIDLSLDRSRWSSLSNLRFYFKSTITIYQVIQYLENSFHLTETDLTTFVYHSKKRSITEKLNFAIFREVFLTEDDIVYCYKLLWDLEKILNSDLEKYNLEIEKLRIDIAKYYGKVLGELILNKDLDKLMRIEHFEQNCKVVKLNEFVPNDFLC